MSINQLEQAIFRDIELTNENDPLWRDAARLVLTAVYDFDADSLAGVGDPAKRLLDQSMRGYDYYVLENKLEHVYDSKRLIAVGGLCIEGATAELNNIAVAEHYQRQGYGKLLVANLERVAGTQGVKLLTIERLRPMSKVYSFWDNQGFRRFSEGDPAMQKVVSIS